MSQSSAAASRGVFRLFTDRKIAVKIAIGFACILAITATLSAISYFAFNKAASAFSDYAYRMQNVTMVRDLDRGFLAMRRYVREFAQTGDEPNVPAAQAERDIVKKSLDNGVATVRNPARNAKLKQIQTLFNAYAANFDKVVPMRRERDKLIRDDLHPTGNAIHVQYEDLRKEAIALDSTAGTKFGDGRQLILQLQLSVAKQLAADDPELLKTSDKYLEDLKATLAKTAAAVGKPETQKNWDNTKALIEKYGQTYRRVDTLSRQIDTLIDGDMKKTADAVATETREMQQAIVSAAQVVESDTQSMMVATEWLVVVLATGGLALGALLAWLIGRSISVPTRAVGAVLVELANGNKMVEVPYSDRRDEVGDNARAAKTFKENLVRIEKMEAEQKAAEAQAAVQRKADMHRLADSFQAAVGGIVDTVSSASSQLEAAANTLTQTAESTQQLSGMVAAASEEASSNVAVGGQRGRRDDRLGRRDQPSGAGFQPHRGRSRAAGRTDRCAHQRTVAGGRPHRRCREADHRDRRTDQPAGAQCHHRGGARRRSRPRLRGGSQRSKGPRRPDREGHRRNRHADRRHAGGNAGVGRRHQTDRQHHRPHLGRSPARSRQPSNSKAPRPARSPAMSARPPRAPRRSPRTSPRSTVAPARPVRLRRKCCHRHSRCRRKATTSRARSTSS